MNATQNSKRTLRALVTRPRENAGSIAAALAERDIDVLLEPLLEIGPTEHDPIDLAGIQAVLVTSAFGVRELAKEVSARDVPVYAVGDTTAAVARELGFTKVESARGDVSALAALVRQRLSPAGGPLLYAAGRTTAGDLPDQLGGDGFEVRRVEVYAARPAAALSPEAKNALQAGETDLVLFFSPRTAATFARLAQEADLTAACRGVSAFCLSPAVAEAAQALPWREVEAAAEPNHESMLTTINDWIARQQPATPEPAPEPVADISPAPVPEPPPPAPAAAPARRTGAGLMAALLLLLLLGGAAGGYLLWREQQRLGEQIAEQRRPVAEDPALAGMEQRIGSLQERVGQDLAGFERRLTARVAEAERRIAGLAEQVEAIRAEPAPAPPEPVAPTEGSEEVDQLRQDLATAVSRMDALESGSEQHAAALASRVDAAERLARELADKVAGLERSTIQLTDTIGGLTPQIDRALRTIEERLTAVTRTANEAAGDQSTSLLLALTQLRAALDSGAPFAPAVGLLRKAAPDDTRITAALGEWTSWADRGIPPLDELQRRFAELAATVREPPPPESDGGWLDRALERAGNVVRVRRVGEAAPPDSPAAIVARAKAALDRNDLAPAVAELERLPAEAKPVFADWLAAARARLAANEALTAVGRAAVERAGAG